MAPDQCSGCSHQALNDALAHARSSDIGAADDQLAITKALIGAGRQGGWENAPPYLLRSLPAHAARQG